MKEAEKAYSSAATLITKVESGEKINSQYYARYILILLGTAYLDQGKTTKAREQFTKILDIFKNDEYAKEALKKLDKKSK